MAMDPHQNPRVSPELLSSLVGKISLATKRSKSFWLVPRDAPEFTTIEREAFVSPESVVIPLGLDMSGMVLLSSKIDRSRLGYDNVEQIELSVGKGFADSQRNAALAGGVSAGVLPWQSSHTGVGESALTLTKRRAEDCPDVDNSAKRSCQPDEGVDRYGSDCTGADAPYHAIREMQQYLAGEGIGWNLRNVFGSEDPTKHGDAAWKFVEWCRCRIKMTSTFHSDIRVKQPMDFAVKLAYMDSLLKQALERSNGHALQRSSICSDYVRLSPSFLRDAAGPMMHFHDTIRGLLDHPSRLMELLVTIAKLVYRKRQRDVNCCIELDDFDVAQPQPKRRRSLHADCAPPTQTKTRGFGDQEAATEETAASFEQA